jgi:hypothetical protein
MQWSVDDADIRRRHLRLQSLMLAIGDAHCARCNTTMQRNQGMTFGENHEVEPTNRFQIQCDVCQTSFMHRVRLAEHLEQKSIGGDCRRSIARAYRGPLRLFDFEYSFQIRLSKVLGRIEQRRSVSILKIKIRCSFLIDCITHTIFAGIQSQPWIRFERG